MPKEPEPLIRKSISLPGRLWAAVADFRFDRRLGSEAEAVRQLLAAGLEAERSGGAKRESRKRKAP